MTKEEIRTRLWVLQDKKYRDFNAMLIPGVEKERVIGVRTPQLRAMAKEIVREERLEDYLDDLDHYFYEERNLYGYVLSEIKDYDECVRRIDAFLPYVDNWGTCDLLSPKVFRRKGVKERLLKDISRWMASGKPFIVRFGIETLMRYFLDEAFDPRYLEWVAAERSEHYYVRMMVAWFFATALAKQWDAALPYMQCQALAPWTHNKTIQKALESFRITDDHKALLRTMKVR